MVLSEHKRVEIYLAKSALRDNRIDSRSLMFHIIGDKVLDCRGYAVLLEPVDVGGSHMAK